ncbi:MAG: hypothetical protein M1436_07810 [Acidobacteria bacterium]|nr:hypothetical protein [Acidobacteriota bacterium]
MALFCWLLLAAMAALAQPYPTFTGTLDRISDKVIALKLDDYRELEFRRTRKTRFAGGANPRSLKRGDRLAIEAEQDVDGGLNAIRVQLDKSGKGKATSAPRKI